MIKKIIMFAWAAGFVVLSFTSVLAGEFKPSLQVISQFEFGDAGYLFDTVFEPKLGYNEQFRASLRFRLGFDYIVSESLSATVGMQVGDFDYGNRSPSGTVGGGAPSAIDFKVRLAYIDWVIPKTPLQTRIGFQTMVLPSIAFGSAVLDTRAPGVSVASPINDNISASAMWIRAKSGDISPTTPATPTRTGGDDVDIFAITLDFGYDEFRITPWAMYAMAGVNAYGFGEVRLPLGIGANTWYIGASFERFMFNPSDEISLFTPFSFALDAYYSSLSLNNRYGDLNADDQNGFFVGMALYYKTSYWWGGIPAIKGWYATGAYVEEGNIVAGEPLSIAGAFDATTIMFGDQVMDNGMSNYNTSPNGTMGIIFEWADVSLVENLNHTLRVAYIKGTNLYTSEGTSFYNLSIEDTIIEFNLNSTYKIYKNLSTTLELGYLIADFGDYYTNGEDDPVMRAALSFTYSL